MIVRNSFGALVFLALVILVGAVVMGQLLTDTEMLNPTRTILMAQVTATASALQVREQLGVIQATETPRAFQVMLVQTQMAAAAQATQTQQAVIAQATAIPMQQTATRAAALAAIAASQADATHTAIAIESQNKVLQARATQTRIAQEQALNAEKASAGATQVAIAVARENDERNNTNLRETLITGAAMMAILGIGAGMAYLLIGKANAIQSAAVAMAERERRRTLETQAAVQARQERQPARTELIHPMPLWDIKKENTKSSSGVRCPGSAFTISEKSLPLLSVCPEDEEARLRQ